MIHAYQVENFETGARSVVIERPTPAKGEVLLKIHACGLNFADLLMAKGTYQDTPKTPFSLGMEVCGTVVEHGDGVTSPAIGTRVAVFGGSGGLAEYGRFDATMCRAIPEKMPSDIAAGFYAAYGTSHLALTDRAKIRPKETLLVLGASGGVGLTAIEIGKALGATVIAVARGPAKLAVAKAAGADHLIDSNDGDFTDAVKALGGADVVYDPVGGTGFKSALRACKPKARIIVIGFASGDVPPIAANHILVKNIDVIGFYWGGYLKFDKDAVMTSIQDLMDMYVAGDLRPHISHVLPLDQADAALDLLRNRTSTGKVVVTID
ncbi:MAG: NADPH:quinone oxidoreductase family protein [Yoonia sp.]